MGQSLLHSSSQPKSDNQRIYVWHWGLESYKNISLSTYQTCLYEPTTNLGYTWIITFEYTL